MAGISQPMALAIKVFLAHTIMLLILKKSTVLYDYFFSIISG
jgi:hypothetical protein